MGMDAPTTLPDWPSLWLREPGLRFTEADGAYLRYSWIGDDEHGGAAWYMCRPDNVPAAHRIVSPEMAAGLCRDAALRWLASEGLDPQISISHVLTGKAVRWAVLTRSDINEADALNAALYAACEAVLNTREANKPPEPPS